tara:strand:- start:134 stop:1042 length:909 start_codon:yes stop_codon:yes gene_type:complete
MLLPENGMRINIEPGLTLRQLTDRLNSNNIISNVGYFSWYGRMNNLDRKIQAGEYNLFSGLTPIAFFDSIINGKVIYYSITFPEGWTFRQIVKLIRKNPKIRQDLKNLNSEEIMNMLGYTNVHPEGRFFPDTYFFSKETSDVDILKRAYKKMDQQLNMAWEARKNKNINIKTKYEALILASIIEKETSLPSEREIISGVFMRRLGLKMKLQTDPTVIYGMGDNYKGNIRRKDLREKNPYNTYVNKGLTPTPICMPGRASINAALNPKAGKELYFVSKGDGSHIFSETLKQHNRAVRKYQLKK